MKGSHGGVIMRVLAKCCVAIALHICALPLAAQEDGPTAPEQLVLDSSSLAVLPFEILSTDPRASEIGSAVYEALLEGLPLIEGLYVVESDLVLPLADSTLRPEEIARLLGIGSVLKGTVSVQRGRWFVSVEHIDAQDGDPWWGANSHFGRVDPGEPQNAIDDLTPEDPALDMLSRVTEHVTRALFPERERDQQQVIAEMRMKILDSSLTDAERVEALDDMPYIGNAASWYVAERSEAFSGPVAVALAQIAMRANDSEVRSKIWWAMSEVGDPNLVQPLLYSLVNDLDEALRRQAAERLVESFLDEPDVRVSLEYAAKNDASEWVRSSIRFSMLSEAEQLHELTATVLDTTKTDRERSSALFELRYNEGRFRELDEEVIIAMTEMARSSTNPRIRDSVWSSLTGTGDAYVVEPLLEALATDQSEEMRDLAARELGGFLDHPGVREALAEVTVQDPSLVVRKTAEESLESVNR